MADHASPDPWDSLAESLGAAPSENKPARPEPPAAPPRSRERQPARQPAAPPVSGDWDSLAAELGVSGRDQPPPARQPAPPADRSRTEGRSRSDQESEPRRPARETSRERVEPVAGADAQGATDEDRGPRPARPRREDTGESDDGSGPRRRRRGRRGGRGRRRDGEGVAGDRAPDRRRDEREPAEGEDRPRRLAAESDRGPEEAGVGGRDADRGERGMDRRYGADLDEPDSGSRSDDGDEPGQRREAGTAGGEEGDRPAKRRRRGRRGGRGRGRTREADGVERGTREPGSTGPADQLDDEPLPASYGSRPGAAGDDRPRSSGGTAQGGRGDGERRGRGRRRRRPGREGGDGRRPAAAAGERREPAGERRDRRRKDDSRSSRSRRSDFAPVAGRYEEDDEGLEFLGVEEAARDSDARPRTPAEDDGVLAESGLTSVLDVPSWVEAIGIVIAGNLAGRSRSGRGDGGKGR